MTKLERGLFTFERPEDEGDFALFVFLDVFEASADSQVGICRRFLTCRFLL
jgi:hypothetical protein